jgi:hypothetical protein
MVAGGACAVGLNLGAKRAEHTFSSGRAADIAKTDEQDALSHWSEASYLLSDRNTALRSG